jgi:uncharacterized protein (DUF58 family)
MLKRSMIGVGIIIVLAGLLWNKIQLTYAGVYLGVLVLGGEFYARRALSRITYRRILDKKRAFVGDTIRLSISVENRKPLPIFHLKCQDEVPCENDLSCDFTLLRSKPGRSYLNVEFHMKWFERVQKEYHFKCLSRGKYAFGPVSMRAGDLTGLSEARCQFQDSVNLTVYPRAPRIMGLKHIARDPFGEAVRRGWIHPDPMAIVGSRPYEPGIPINQIHWRATAKTGSLQARKLEPTTRSSVLVALNLATSDYLWEGIDRQALETSVVIAAGILRELHENKIAFGLTANSPSPSMNRLLLRPGLSNDHLNRALEVLATVTLPWGDFSKLLADSVAILERGVRLLIVLPHQTRKEWESILRMYLEVQDIVVLILYKNRDFSQFYSKVPTYCLGSPVDWQTVEVITFERLA